MFFERKKVPRQQRSSFSVFCFVCLVFVFFGGYLYWLRLRFSAWAGELVCGFRTPKNEGSEETPPTRRIAPPLGGKPRGLATEQKRNAHPDLAMTHAQCRVCRLEAVKRPSCMWKGQTGADDNYRRARVARLAECHRKQKAGYCQDATPT